MNLVNLKLDADTLTGIINYLLTDIENVNSPDVWQLLRIKHSGKGLRKAIENRWINKVHPDDRAKIEDKVIFGVYVYSYKKTDLKDPIFLYVGVGASQGIGIRKRLMDHTVEAIDISCGNAQKWLDFWGFRDFKKGYLSVNVLEVCLKKENEKKKAAPEGKVLRSIFEAYLSQKLFPLFDCIYNPEKFVVDDEKGKKTVEEIKEKIKELKNKGPCIDAKIKKPISNRNKIYRKIICSAMELQNFLRQ
jgi:hypothetical protein